MTQYGDRPTEPLPDFEATFRAFIERRELRIPVCPETGLVLGLSMRLRPDDLGWTIAWVAASGLARLHSFVIYHRSYHAAFPVPYHVAQVALEEGVLLTGRVRGVALTELVVDMPLQAAFTENGALVFDPLTPAPAK